MALARGTILRLEGAEADQRDLLTILQSFHNGIENTVDDLVHVLAGNSGFFCYGRDAFSLIQSFFLPFIISNGFYFNSDGR